MKLKNASSNMKMNTNLQDIKNEPIRIEMCRKRWKYEKFKRKHPPVQSRNITQPSNQTDTTTHKQIINHNN